MRMAFGPTVGSWRGTLERFEPSNEWFLLVSEPDSARNALIRAKNAYAHSSEISGLFGTEAEIVRAADSVVLEWENMRWR
ncbi:hypothetical protein AB0H98_00765 [Nocardia salmonicida]|uniref:hypothetical protein n=1 Tax=Nocardia salmonicida TaxID=53431 RepID=UPI0033C8F236